MKLNALTSPLYIDVYLSIRISSLMHLVIFEAPTFHFLKTLKDYYLWFFYDYITMDWSLVPNNGIRTLAPNTSKMVNLNTILDKLPFILSCNC